MKKVTEADFRKEEFRDANIEDYEFRADGEVVRKDRWEMAIRKIQMLVLPEMREFEIDKVVSEVERMVVDKGIQ